MTVPLFYQFRKLVPLFLTCGAVIEVLVLHEPVPHFTIRPNVKESGLRSTVVAPIH